MARSLRTVLRDLLAYIEYAGSNKVSDANVLMNVHHDISGIVQNKSCFTPRTAGYSKLAAESSQE